MSRFLRSLICDTIRNSGPISVAQYMQYALYHPEYGYYRKKQPLGALGDFTTAPEISQIFGELIGAWCVDMWHKMGAPNSVAVVELGPGRGTLMADFLRATQQDQAFTQARSIHFVEVNEALQAVQQQAVAEAHWHSDLSSVPKEPCIIIGNEFLDCFPIHQYCKEAQGWSEIKVGLDKKEGLMFMREPTIDLDAQIPHAKPGTIYESSPALLHYSEAVASHIKTHGGVALWIDYGYTKPQGATLQALSKHQHVSPLATPGEADLTALVDFTVLTQHMKQQDMHVLGPVTQGEFLKQLGIELRMQQLLYKATSRQAEEITSGVSRLIDEKQMGALFKVLAVSNLPVENIVGFDHETL